MVPIEFKRESYEPEEDKDGEVESNDEEEEEGEGSEDDDEDYHDDEVEEEDDSEEENEESVGTGAGYREEVANRRRKGKNILFKKKSNKSLLQKQKGSCGKGSSSKGIDEHTQSLENPMNPSFAPNLLRKRIDVLRMPAKLIGDYDLKFCEVITLVDPLGKLVRKIIERVHDVNVTRFGSIHRRNKIKPDDLMVCELLREDDGCVHVIKVHIIRR